LFIDAHCHLERATYDEELDAVIDRAFAAGLTHLIAVGASSRLNGATEAVALAKTDPRIFAAVGFHPHEAAQMRAEDLDRLSVLLKEPKVVALGEIGLDYYYDHSPRQQQRHAFGELLRLGRSGKHPIMLHVRDAHADTVALLDEVGLPPAGGVVHCFTGGPAEAQEYLQRGMYLSIPGVVTFKSAQALRDAVQIIPVDRLLIETDSPYLAPVPHRGKRNEPAFLVHTAQAIGALLGMSGPDLGSIARENTLRLFRLPGGEI
jgi:TatD DNase family protein